MHFNYRPKPWEFFLLSLRILPTSRLGKLAILLVLIINTISFAITSPSIFYRAIQQGDIDIIIITIILAYLPVFFLFITVLAIMTILRMILYRNLFKEDIEYFIAKDKIISQKEGVKTEYNWKIFKKVKKVLGAFIFYTELINEPLMYIPDRAFPDNQTLKEFTKLLIDKGLGTKLES